MDKKQTAKLLDGDLIITILLLVMSIVMFIMSTDFPAEARRLPMLVTLVTGVCCLASIVRRLYPAKKSQKKMTSPDCKEENAVAETPNQVKVWKWLGVFLIMIAYYFLAKSIGYIITSTLVLLAVPFYLGYRKWWVVLIVALVFSLGTYFLFKGFFHVPLPMGSLFK